ncbi:MAG: hypothetical protein IPP90_09175 [Gemmatimonadaceae bacterium]|nr:hypothetical protein [Gemmatimonadaceae bacterium]
MRSLRTVLLLSCSAPLALRAQDRPPIRPLGPVQSSSTDSLGATMNVRALPNGRLLINDVMSRRVLLVDSTFTVLAIVADSTSSTANAYGPSSASLIPFRGDSTLFIDAASLSMLVIDPSGKIARVMSVPRTQDAGMLVAGGLGAGAFYSGNHLVYRAAPRFQMRMGANGSPGMPSVADTMAVVRVNLSTRVMDTVGFVRIPKVNTSIGNVDGKFSVSIETNPLPVIDEWAVTSTGQIAIIRGKDYHVDWMSPDGTRKTSPKMPFDWKRMSDDDKATFLDSVKVQRERFAAANPSQASQIAQAFSTIFGGSAATAAPMMASMGAGFGGGPGAGGGRGAGGGGGGMPQVSIQITSVLASELPDYQPPFFATSSKPDADGNVWIRTINTRMIPGGAIYDVINGNGDVIDRVQIPVGRSIAGFGPGGVVILARVEGTSTRLERARVR